MAIPTCNIDFYCDETILDHFPVYDTLRELGSVVYLPANDLYGKRPA